MHPALAACLLVVMLSACSHWEKPGATEADFEAAKAACNARGFARFPPANQQIASSYSTPSHTSCTTTGSAYMATTDCTTTPGFTPDPITVDQNQSARNADYRACMYENGWSNVRNR